MGPLLWLSRVLQAQVPQADQRIVSVAYASLVATRRPMVEVAMYLVREAIWQQLEADASARAGDPQTSLSHQQLNANFIALLRKTITEYPAPQASAPGQAESIVSLMNLFLQTADADEQRLILQTAVWVFSRGEEVPNFNAEWGRALLRALGSATTDASAEEVLTLWTARHPAATGFFLRELGLARLRNDSLTADALEMIAQNAIPPENLLKYLFYTDVRWTDQKEALRILVSKPSLPAIQEDAINVSNMTALLEDPETQEMTLMFLERVLNGRLITRSEPVIDPLAYQALTFNEDLQHFEVAVTGENPPPLEEGGAISALAFLFLSEAAKAEALGKTAWSDRLRNAARPIMRDPRSLLSFLAKITDDFGVDARLLASEAVAVEALDAMSDDELAQVVLHDPRLVLVLLRLRYRPDSRFQQSAARALRYVRTTHPEAMRALSDEKVGRRWGENVSEATLNRWIELIVSAQGDFDKLQQAISTDHADLLETLRRMRLYMNTKTETLDAVMSLDGEYIDVFKLADEIYDRMNFEENADRRHALLLFLDHFSDHIAINRELNPRLIVHLIDDIPDTRFRAAALRAFVKSRDASGAIFIERIWTAARPFLVAALASNAPGDVQTLMSLVSDAWKYDVYKDLHVLSFLRQETDSRLSSWLLTLVKSNAKQYLDPTLLVWLSDHLKDPDLGPSVKNILGDNQEEWNLFRDELLVKHMDTVEEMRGFEPTAASVWLNSLDSDIAAHALTLLNGTAVAVSVQNSADFLTAFMRSLARSSPGGQAAVVRVAQQAVFAPTASRRPWLEGLLSARISASLRGQAAIDAVLDRALRDGLSRQDLQTFASSSIDNRIRDEANRQLNRPLARASVPFVLQGGLTAEPSRINTRRDLGRIVSSPFIFPLLLLLVGLPLASQSADGTAGWLSPLPVFLLSAGVIYWGMKALIKSARFSAPLKLLAVSGVFAIPLFLHQFNVFGSDLVYFSFQSTVMMGLFLAGYAWVYRKQLRQADVPSALRTAARASVWLVVLWPWSAVFHEMIHAFVARAWNPTWVVIPGWEQFILLATMAYAAMALVFPSLRRRGLAVLGGTAVVITILGFLSFQPLLGQTPLVSLFGRHRLLDVLHTFFTQSNPLGSLISFFRYAAAPSGLHAQGAFWGPTYGKFSYIMSSPAIQVVFLVPHFVQAFLSIVLFRYAARRQNLQLQMIAFGLAAYPTFGGTAIDYRFGSGGLIEDFYVMGFVWWVAWEISNLLRMIVQKVRHPMQSPVVSISSLPIFKNLYPFLIPLSFVALFTLYLSVFVLSPGPWEVIMNGNVLRWVSHVLNINYPSVVLSATAYGLFRLGRYLHNRRELYVAA
jgi:hypothetical protein